MPGKTERARALEDLYHARKRILIDDDDTDSDAVDEEMQANLELTATILSQRSLKRPSRYRNKGFNADLAFHEWLNDRRYVVFTHMTRASFDYVYEMIHQDPVFVNPNILSPSHQRSVYFQLFIALSRLVSNGDGWNLDKVS